MIARHAPLLVALLGALSVPAASLAQPPQPPQPPPTTIPRPAHPDPRYLPAMRAELEALSIAHTCEATSAMRAECSWSFRGTTSQQELSVEAIYSDDTDTVYFYVARFALAPADAPSTPAVLRQLMELNWALLLGKLEWDPTTGEVRLAMVLNTDSNFDRRAFRSVVRSLHAVADRYWGDVQRTITAREGDGPTR